MNLIEKIQDSFYKFLEENFNLKSEQAKNCEFILNIDEAKKEFGDINSNAALILSKELKKNPREIAQTIKTNFINENINKIEIAGPGFLNFFLTNEAYIKLAKEIFELKEKFYKIDEKEIKKHNYSVEFVSANPTGPLHFGHGRGGIIGDVFGNILRFLGHNVTKEFYINDAGSQIKKLGISFKIRCQQEIGMEVQIPEDGYHGEYLIELAKECIKEQGKDIISKDDDFFSQYAKEKLLEKIKKTLIDYGIEFDAWFSEKSLYENNSVQKSIKQLSDSGYIYEKENAIWFKSTIFGDDKDRVLVKSDGEYTYAASDIAYMKSKIDRGSDYLIMVLGQDHHGYVSRLEGIKKALRFEKYPLHVILYQLVKMKESGQLIKMSKRAGSFISLQDIIDTVGKDVARFFFLNRKADAQLEFDLDLALKKTEENPVFYIQYAYVRTVSILEKAKDEKELQNLTIDNLNNLSTEEFYLLKKIVSLKNLLETIAKNYQTHLLAYYVIELATIFHRYYYNNRIIEISNIEKSKARLMMTLIINDCFATCLKLLGVSQPKHM